MERYLGGEEIEPEALHVAFERALREGHLIPILFSSGRTGAGLAELLNFIVKLAPNPLEGNPPLFEKWPGGDAASAEPLAVNHDKNAHVIAHVFKVEVDPYMGKVGTLRVLQGTITPDSMLYVGEARKPIRVAHLYAVQGKQLLPVASAGPGEICAVTKMEDVTFDAVLHDAPEDAVIHFRPLHFPHAVYGLAVRVKRKGDEQKLAEVLHRLAIEDRDCTSKAISPPMKLSSVGKGNCIWAGCWSACARSTSLRSTATRPPFPIARRCRSRQKDITGIRNKAGERASLAKSSCAFHR
jgi:elongation factor G